MWTSRCAGCHQPGRLLCAGCAGTGPLQLLSEPIPMVHGALTAGRYDGPLGRAVLRAKGAPDRDVGVAVARAFAHRVRSDPAALALLRSCALVTWAPSPWTRRLRRGFALGALIAAPLPGGAPRRAALRLAPGRRQAGLDRGARHGALKGRLRSIGVVRGRILLVDDVVTTGATAQACARELLGAGADEVWVLSVCAAISSSAGAAGGPPASPFAIERDNPGPTFEPLARTESTREPPRLTA